MASKKEQQKLIVFSTPEIKDMVENIIADQATVTHKSSSALYEMCILDSLLPCNAIGKELYTRLYSGTPVKDILEAIYSNSGAGMFFKPMWNPDTIYPFVMYTKKIMSLNHFRHRHTQYNQDEAPYLISQLKTILHLLENYAEQHSEALLTETIKNLQDMIRLSDQNLEEIRLINYIQIIQDNWEIVKDNQYTYRALMSIMKTEYPWKITSEERYECGELIKRYSPNWD